MAKLELKPQGLIDKAALAHLESRQLLRSFSHLDVWLHEHAVAFTIAKMMDKDLLRDVQNELIKAQKQGLSFAEFQKNVKPMLMKKGWWGEKVMVDPVDGKAKLVQLGSTRRLRTIYQTNMRTARAASQWQRIQESKRFLPYLRYNASAAQNKRDAHQKYYGWILPVDHPIWQYIFPPNGYGCLCTVSQLTRGQAEREGITPEPEIEWKEVVNKRTGQVVRVPAGIDPSFAHNHGDRLKALEALFGEKHGQNALQEMIQEREKYISERYQMPDIQTTAFPKVADKKEVERLLFDSATQKSVRHEAEAAAQLQKVLGVRLERYIPNEKERTNFLPTPDFKIVGQKGSKGKTVDFMFTMDSNNHKAIEKLNANFYLVDNLQNAKRKKKRKDGIAEHLKKADIVPLDLRYLNAFNRALLLEYVLSLPEEQREKIMLIVEETK